MNQKRTTRRAISAPLPDPKPAIERVKSVSAEIEIEAEADRVWSLLTEFRHWPAWGPTLRAVESEFETVAPGVSGRVQTFLGFWLSFEIEEFESGRFWDWSVGGIRATGHRVIPISPDRTRVVFTVPRRFRFYRWVLVWGLRRIARIAESR